MVLQYNYSFIIKILNSCIIYDANKSVSVIFGTVIRFSSKTKALFKTKLLYFVKFTKNTVNRVNERKLKY